jgi:DNA-binding LacI/PurR family transcriptional regulator
VAELRQEMSVSLTTLDAALRKLEHRQLIYRVQGSGIFVSPRASAGIVLICDPFYFRGASHSPFWDMLMEEARLRAQAHGEQFSCHFAMSSESHDLPLHEGLTQQVLDGRVQGVLGVGLNEESAQWLAEQRVPVAGFAGDAKPYVQLSDEVLVEKGVQHLAELGCCRIGLWSPVAQFHTVYVPGMKHRLLAFKAELSKHNLPFYPEMVYDNHHLLELTHEERGIQSAESHQEQGFRVAREVFGNSNPMKPDGLVICDDLMTHGALMALQKEAVRIGEDVHIASHANRGSNVLMGHDELTLIEYDPAEVVAAMFDLLEMQIDGQTPPPEVVIMPQLRLSSSS